MPIRKEERGKYPRNWNHIRAQIIMRAGNKCEGCGLQNGSLIIRTGPGERDFEYIEGEGEFAAAIADGYHPVQVVLTVAHLDHDPTNCDPENLRAWCQKCHNGYDAKHRAEGIKRRKAERAGQLSMESE